MDDLSRTSTLHCLGKIGEEGLKRFELTIWYAHDDEAEVKLSQVVLAFQLAINRDENVVPGFRELQERAILRAAPADFGDSPDGMPGKSRFQARRNAFI